MVKIKTGKYGLEWGIVLLFSALPISQILKLITKTEKIDFASVILVIALLLIFNIKNTLKFAFPTFNMVTLYLILFQIYTIILALYAGIGLFDSNYGIIYIIFTIVLMLAFTTNNRSINSEVLIKTFVYVTGFFNVLLFYYLSNGFTTMELTYVNGIYSNANNLIADRLTLSTIAYGYYIGFMLYKPKKILNVLLKYGFASISLLNILATNRRGLMVSFLIVLMMHIFYTFNKKNFNTNQINKLVKKILSGIGIIVFLIFIQNKIPFIGLSIERFIFTLKNGILNFIGIDSYGIDVAANVRVNSREMAIEIIESSTFFELLFGHGYMTKWIDFPFLQGIVDMGIIGGSIYFLLQTIIVIKCILNNQNKSDAILFITYFSIIGFIYNFYSGLPYGYYKYVYLIPLYYISIYHSKKSLK